MAAVNAHAAQLPFILCADDYALTPQIDAGILDLAQRGRISAISCMTSSPRWPQAAVALQALRGKVAIGLHFNLTDAPLLQTRMPAQSLTSCLWRSHLRCLPAKAIARELQLQWQAFVEQMQVAPDFIDGHQHVHVLPQVQPVFLQQLEQLDPSAKTFVRLPYSRPWYYLLRGELKPAIIAAAGGYRLRRGLQASGRAHNPSFAGAYNFAAKDYGAVFRAALSAIKQQRQAYGMIMCHPAKRLPLAEAQLKNPGNPLPVASVVDVAAVTDHDDPIAAARYLEWDYFNSQMFTEDCQQLGLRLSAISYN